MNQLAQKQGTSLIAPRDYNRSQLQLIKRTVAKDTTDDEFNMFIEICKRQGLDPFRRQIYAFVFNKDKADKRQFVTVTGIDGYRAIAKRTGTYRASDSEAEIEYDESKVDPKLNPKGIVKATVIVYQFGPDRQWYPVVGSARWEEFAPIIDEWENRQKTGGKKLGKENWVTMPHVMIAKCAEAQALRKGWPEEFSGLYTFDEMDRSIIDMTAAEEIAAFEEEERMTKVGANESAPFVFNFMEGVEFVPYGKIADRVLAHIKSLETASEIGMWREANRAGLQQFWAKRKSEALDVKAEIEKVMQSKPKFNDEKPNILMAGLIVTA